MEKGLNIALYMVMLLMFNEKNIPKFISYLPPPLRIIFVTIIFILLIVKNDYDQLDFENKEIKRS